MSDIVYVMQAGTMDIFKIGKAGDAKRRKYNLQAGCPYPLQLKNIIETDNAIWLEHCLHVILRKYNMRGDWFEITESKLAHILYRILPALLEEDGNTHAGTHCLRCKALEKFLDSMNMDMKCHECTVVYPIGIYSTREAA